MSYKTYPIEAPWLGVVSEVPTIKAPSGAFDDMVNMFATRGRIQTRPALATFGTATDTKKVYILRSYVDINLSLHTLAITTKNAYHLTAGPIFNALSFPAGVVDLGSVDRPFATAALYNRIYFSNGEVNVLYADGSTTLKMAGDVPSAARFVGVVGGHVMLAYCKEAIAGTPRTFPNRVRWSAVGDPNAWSSYTSGFADIIEVQDEITGLVGFGRSGVLFGMNSIVVVTATGIGTKPFAFEHLATEPDGVGNKYPYSLATYGNRYTVFVADDDIYLLMIPNPQPIGGLAKRAIFKDIAVATGPIVGRIVANLGVAYDFLSYWLTIPKTPATDSVSWVFSSVDRTWQRFTSSSGALGALSTVYVS